MRFIPILMSPPMVQAIQAGRKTKTRRTRGLESLNVDPKAVLSVNSTPFPSDSTTTARWFIKWFGGDNTLERCPYGQPGDVLWVREKFCFIGHLPFDYYKYAADYGEEPVDWNWKPSIHMPKTACRIFLEVVSIKVERLQDISHKDALQEGVLTIPALDNNKKMYYIIPGRTDNNCWASAIGAFNNLWIKINGADSWDANPWVWVVEFKRIDKPANFLK